MNYGQKAVTMILMKYLWLILLSGCASSPYLEMKFVHQVDRMSDWVLQPERPWTPKEAETRTHLTVGLEWKDVNCPYVERIFQGPWDQMLIGCSRRFGKAVGENTRLFIEPALVHQVDGETSPFLRTDEKQWQGHNPFVQLRIGIKHYGFRCPVIATGKSLFQGAPFEREDHAPDLYWTNIECGVRLWGNEGILNAR